MATYRYNVVVDVSLKTDNLNRNTQAQKQHLRSMEQDVLDSQRRMDKELSNSVANRQKMERQYSDWNSQEIGRRQILRQKDYQNQIEQTRRLNDDVIALETRRNQQLAAENQRYHQQRFQQQRAAFEAEQRLKQSVGMGSRGLLYSPDQIRSQTAANASTQANLRNFYGNNISQGMDNITNILNGQNIADADRKIKQLTKTTADSTKGLGMWGQAFKGAFVGAVAGMTFSLIIGGIFGITRAIGELTVSAIQLAGDFEVTTNALAVFTGSVSSAKQELAEIDKLAKDTPGLRLVSAQEGYQRLRALGFEANLAKGFIKELGEEKILSGADDEAIQKVIFNFAQIASGGQKVSQEMREIVTQMPTLKRAFADAFGTTNPAKIQDFFDRDSDKAFQMLIDAMARGEAAAGGFNDAWGKLLDSFITAGRLFGEPVMEPLTNEIKDLTGAIEGNADTWTAWGMHFADIIRGAGVEIKAINQATSESPFWASAWNAAKIAFNLNPAGSWAQNGADVRRGEGLSILEQEAKEERDILRGQAMADEMWRDEQEKKLEQHYKRVAESLEDSKDERLEISSNFYRIEEARLSAHLSFSLEQEQINNKLLSASRIAALKSQLSIVEGYYKTLYEVSNLSAEQTFKTQRQEQIELSKIYADIAIERIEARKREMEADIRIQEQGNTRRRENASADADSEMRLAEARINRRITLSIEGERQATTQIGRIRETSLLAQIRLQEDFFDRQATLYSNDAGKVAEIEQERNLTINKLNDDLRINTLETERQIQEQTEQIRIQGIQRRRELSEAEIRSLSQSASLFASRFALFTPERVGAGSIDKLLGTGDIGKIRELRKEIEVLNQQLIKAINVGDDTVTSIGDKIVYKDILIKGLESDVPKLALDLFNLAEQLKTTDDYTIFDKINEQALMVERRLAESQILADIDRIQAEISGEQAFISRQRGNIGKEGGPTQVDFDAWAPSGMTDNLKKLNRELKDAQNNLKLTKEQFDAAKVDQYNQSLKGLGETLEKLRSGDKSSINAFKFLASKEQAEAEVSVLYRIIAAETKLAESSEAISDRRKLAYREAELEIKSAEEQAYIRQDKARLQIADKYVFSQAQSDAKLLEFFAAQKGITDILSDAKINLMTSAFSGLDRVAASLAKNFGFAKDMVAQLIGSLLKLVANQIFMKLFGLSPSGGGQSGGGFGGMFGGGIGGTPNFNPNAGGIGGGGNIIQQLLGGGGQSGGGFNPFGGFGGANIGGFGSGGSAGLPSINLGDGIPAPQTGGNGRGGSGGMSGLGMGISIASIAAMAIGSRIGGIGGSALQYGGMGAQVGFMFGGPLGALVGGGIGAIGGLIAGIFGRNSKRKKEEKLRTIAINEALAAVDKLIEQVQNDQIDGNQALEQVDAIRSNYLNTVGALTDKKTRGIAQKDVSRIDAKIESLKAAVAAQNARRQRLELYAPTFADGGSLSRFASNNYRHNPLGYQRGGQKLGFFPASGQHAIYNERGSEYIFDAETTRNVGVDRLDLIRQTKGQVLNSMLFRPVHIQEKAEGGPLALTMPQFAAQPAMQSQPTQVILNIDGSAMGQIMAQALSIVIKENNGSEQQINALSNGIENQGQSKLVEQIAELVLQKLGK